MQTGETCIPQNSYSSVGQTVDQTDAGEGEEEEEEEEEDQGPPEIDPATGQPIPRPKKKKKKAGKRKFRGKLSSKPQDFQVGRF